MANERDNEAEIVELNENWPVPNQPVQQVKTNYTTAVAVQQPRNLKAVEQRLLQEAALLGDEAYYGWAAGKDRIEGPSHDLAVAAARCFGNCAVDNNGVEESAYAYVFTSSFIDLETGFTISRPFRQSKKWKIYGKMDDFRKEDVRFQIGASKSARNVILEALPKPLIRRALQEAKRSVRTDIEENIDKKGIDVVRQSMAKAFAKEGISEERILEKYERSSLKAITVEDLVLLKGDLRAIQEEVESAATLFPIKRDDLDDPSMSQTERVKNKLKMKAKPEPDEEAAQEETPAEPGKEDPANALITTLEENGFSVEEAEDYAEAQFKKALGELTDAQTWTLVSQVKAGKMQDWLMENK